MSNARSGCDGARHYLTVLFADLSDSTQLSELMQAEEYAMLLADLRAICREIIPRHGGRIARIQGDGVLAFFGWPQADEDDGRRATDAALELHAAVARLPPGGDGQAALRLHSGIHGGLVLVAEGDLERGRFELLGNVPNIAARLSAEAAKDDIVVSEETLGRNLRHFTASERQVLAVRGVAAPLGVHRIYGRAAQPDRTVAIMRRRPSPFVGREHELRALYELLRGACRGANVCCFVSAGAGMGKSRLLDEFVDRYAQDGCVALRGYCESHLGAQPLQPFAQILRALDATGSSAPTDARDRARAVLQTGLGAAESSIAEVCGALDALAAHVPLLLVLDDWQWADEASQQVLQSLRDLDRAMLVVLATRVAGRELLLARPAEAIELQPLNLAASARITEALLPGADPFVSAEIHRYAGGTPLIVEELCHAARLRGPSWPQSLRFGSAAWLSGLIESRIALLPQQQIEIARAAAVIGAVFPSWLLQQLTGCGADHPAVRALAAADVLFPGEEPETLRFKHGVTRDVIYDAIGLRERQRLHQAIVDALSADESSAEQHVESLAYHCAAARLPAQAAIHAEQAGDRAMMACALDRARAQYVATLTALDAVGLLSAQAGHRWCAVTHKLGLACVFDPLSIPDVALFERAVELARRGGRSDVIARCEYWLAYVLYSKGRALDARPHCEAALVTAVQLGDARFAAQVQSVYGQVLQLATDYAGALVLFDAALEHRSAPPSRPARSVPAGAVYTLACKACLLGDRGEFDAAHACFDEAMALIGDVRHQVVSSVLHWRCLVLQWQGRWTEALAMGEHSASVAEATRSRHQLSVGRSMAAYVGWVLSRDEEHAQMLRDATAWIEARGGRLAVSLNHSWMIEIALACGREEEARRHAASLFRRSRQADRLGEALGCRALARAASKLSQRARAERYLARADDAARARCSAHELASNRLCEAQLMFDAKRPQQGLELLEVASGMFDRLSMAWHLDRARRLARQAQA